MGVFALKDIAVGEEIHREKPLTIYENGVESVKLAPKKEKLRWTFHDAFNYEGPGTKSIAGIGKTNGIPVNDKQGLFLLACRMNHACNGAQNARYKWREDLGRMMVRAIRPIQTGEEVLVNYIGCYMPRQERQDVLWNEFRFKCICNECTTKWSKSRDETLEKIRQSIDHGYVQVAEHEPVRALGMVEELLKTLEEEDLNTPMDLGTIHYDAVQIAQRAYDIKKVRFHLKKAHECWLQTDGEGSHYDLMGREMMERFAGKEWETIANSQRPAGLR